MERRVLLASDLDGTLIPTDDGPEHRSGVARFNAAFSEPRDIGLAYVTGRRRELADEGISSLGLPAPDYLVCDVGTSVFVRGRRGLEPDGEYRSRMVAAMGGASADEVRQLLSDVPHLSLQSPEDQTDFKASFDFPEEHHEHVLEDVRERVGGRPLSVVVSFDPYTGAGLLDILPGGVAKDTAIRYLHDALGLEPDHLYYAGDSGNDVAAMLAGYRVIVVGNARTELKALLASEAGAMGLQDRLYFAKAPYAAGVLEGCFHWGLLEADVGPG